MSARSPTLAFSRVPPPGTRPSCPVVPLAGLVLLRDVGLLASGFLVRYKSLPKPFSWPQYFDPSIPSAEIRPTLMSKLNTCLQIVLLAGTLAVPIAGLPVHWLPLVIMQWAVAGTTAWTGITYMWFHRQVIRYIK